MIRIGRHVLIPPIPWNPCKYGARTHTKDFKSSPSFSFPKKFKKGRPTSRPPRFSPSLPPPVKKGQKQKLHRSKKSREKERREGEEGRVGPISIFKAKKEKGQADDRPTGEGKRVGKTFRLQPPSLPRNNITTKEKEISVGRGASLQGWRECPGWMEDCCSVFGSKIGGGGGSGLFVWKEENFIPLFSHPLFSSLLDRFQRPSPLLLSSKAGRRVSGGRKEPRRRSSTLPFPSPLAPKTPIPLFSSPAGGRPLHSLTTQQPPPPPPPPQALFPFRAKPSRLQIFHPDGGREK